MKVYLKTISEVVEFMRGWGTGGEQLICRWVNNSVGYLIEIDPQS